MMHTIYLWDEAPNIGCGLRKVVVEHEGRIWIRLIYPPTLATARIRRSVWEKIKKNTTKANRSALTRQAKSYIEAVETLGLGSNSETAHKSRVRKLRERARRMIKAA